MIGTRKRLHAVDLYLPTAMVSTRQSTKRRQTVREGAHLGDSGEDYDPGDESSGLPKARRPKPRASGKGTSEQKGKQRGGRRNAGRLSKLPDMPLDILYEVSGGIVPSLTTG